MHLLGFDLDGEARGPDAGAGRLRRGEERGEVLVADPRPGDAAARRFEVLRLGGRALNAGERDAFGVEPENVDERRLVTVEPVHPGAVRVLRGVDRLDRPREKVVAGVFHRGRAAVGEGDVEVDGILRRALHLRRQGEGFGDRQPVGVRAFADDLVALDRHGVRLAIRVARLGEERADRVAGVLVEDHLGVFVALAAFIGALALFLIAGGAGGPCSAGSLVMEQPDALDAAAEIGEGVLRRGGRHRLLLLRHSRFRRLRRGGEGRGGGGGRGRGDGGSGGGERGACLGGLGGLFGLRVRFAPLLDLFLGFELPPDEDDYREDDSDDAFAIHKIVEKPRAGGAGKVSGEGRLV